MEAKTETRAPFNLDAPPMPKIAKNEMVIAAEDGVIAHAMNIIGKRLRKPGERLSCTEDSSGYLILKLAQEPIEHFGILLLDCDLRLIEDFMPFRGTVDHVSAPGRELVKRALEVGADSVIAYHNHPSQNPTASIPDLTMTKYLVRALDLFDIRLYDHIIVGGTQYYSMAREGVLPKP